MYVCFSVLDSLTATFSGDNFIRYEIETTLSVRPLRQTATYTTAQNSISLSFATSNPSGVILQLGRPSDSQEYAILEVMNSITADISLLYGVEVPNT